ncbi:ABC transporter ATP-binding protein [Puniceicoccales bacterium CK1056]|uniref:ABC transporter ATP-binding protein n=1 Tax=Oceanipulchritudo coccoides TaxID=2706888 RepID=A0A6B2M1R3_9BACT|nr:ABC transporter ATP-binding protein [Oceanipulchritudo coccoides]NDV62316.1 ABC transporter ATP-binding protein [Oceanipulchritudo coccoides]
MHTFWSKISRVFLIAAPYGKKKLFIMFLVALLQGLLQVVGVTSIFPFLALAANPTLFMESGLGQSVLGILPEITEQQLLVLSGVFAVMMLGIANGMLLFGEVFRARYVQGLGHWLRVRLLTRMVNNPYNYFLSRNTGELIKKASGDVMNFIAGILAPLMDLVARLITVGLLIGTLLIISPRLTLIAGAALGLYYLSVYKLLGALRRRTSDGLKIANRGAMKEALQCLSGIKPIKVHGVEEHFINRYSLHTAMLARLSKWMPVVSNGPRYLIEPLAFGGIVIVVLYYIISGGELDKVLPILGVMALAGYRLLPNMQLIYGAFSGISLSSHALEEIHEELTSTSDPSYQMPARFRGGQGIKAIEWNEQIELRGISFSYAEAKRPVLSGLNLIIPKNQFFAFIGETGSGKSTLIDLILGLHWPSEGSLLIDGKPLEESEKRAWRAGIGYVPQDIFLMDDTIAANIAFGISPKEIDYDRVREVAEAAQIRGFIEAELPAGFDTRTGERGVRLSGGQRQRIGLARALYHRPSLLILDEATSALDNQTEAALMSAIEGLQGKLSLLVIAHRLTTVQRADQVVLLKDGGIGAQGTYDEVVSLLPGNETTE